MNFSDNEDLETPRCAIVGTRKTLPGLRQARKEDRQPDQGHLAADYSMRLLLD